MSRIAADSARSGVYHASARLCAARPSNMSCRLASGSRGLGRDVAKRKTLALGIDAINYPFHDLNSFVGRRLVNEAQRSLKSNGVASFAGFLSPDATSRMAAEVSDRLNAAHETDSEHNAWQRPGNLPEYPAQHVVNTSMRTRVASLPFDSIGPSLQALYAWPFWPRFLEAVLDRPAGSVYPLDDSLGCCSVNVFRPGWSHAWHFDQAAYSVTLSLQSAENGGEFLTTPPLRSSDSVLATDAVAATIKAHSSYTFEAPSADELPAPPPIHAAPFEEGTLQIFGGRYCLHAVSEVIGRRDRLSAVLCFAPEPGQRNTPEVQRMFWGREAQ